MIKRLKAKFKALEYGHVGDFGNDVSTPRTRRKAMWHFHLFDHAFLRGAWTNLAEFTPGGWRSNQPSPARIKKMAEMGIKTVVSLRGDADVSFNLLEAQACKEHGLTFIQTGGIAARSAVPKENFLKMLAFLETLEKPFLIHCKSGADRAGLVSALYLLHIENAPIEVAKKQLSLKHMHLKSTKTGVLDHFLQAYEDHLSIHGPTPIKAWIEHHYDRDAVNGSFKTMTRFP